ncbi:glycoprotein-N-acetylgalactosamine 3-beta-galactosyltransferase 1 isoform X2 [Drosophila ananassae]|uniref:glycoprotein-N-acetylgalactosamine 3-beta-galactosyltransferase 1 isoform X2 n=1 Tax=Drosophila ananassae TaxID=7217 RepID=UPI001CFFDBEF|nr:glycoprotein-N-acetylgalactosamine 3-beta-galactosyltransferase 1 isoform X2 [Drosophila ananassae]
MTYNALALVTGLIIGIRWTEYGQYSSSKLIEKTQQNIFYPQDLSTSLFNETRVLCLVLKDPSDFGRKQAKDNDTFSIVKKGMGHVFEKYINNYDWFLRADTNTFVIMENLRRFLYQYDAESPLYFGHRLKSDFKEGYMSGDAGYVLSKGALRLLNLIAFQNNTICGLNLNSSLMPEDKQIALCLKNVRVIAGDSRDEKGQERFLPMMPHWMGPGFKRWKNYSKSVYFKPARRACCSSSLITFHPANGYVFDLWEFFLHRVRIFGCPQMAPQKLPPRLSFGEMHAQLGYWSQVVSDNHG